jgi:hypothetical protein
MLAFLFMEKKTSKIPLWFSIGILILLMVYLAFAQSVHITQNPFYQFGNIAIIAVGIFGATKRYKATHEDHISFRKAIGVGLATTATTAIIYGVCIFFYSLADADFSYSLVDDQLSDFLKAVHNFGIAFMETIVVGIVATLTSTIYLQEGRKSVEFKEKQEDVG